MTRPVVDSVNKLTLTYRGGDCSEFVIGQIMGPDMHGGYVEAVHAVYDASLDVTVVEFKPVSPNDQRYTMPDPFGFTRVVASDDEIDTKGPGSRE